MGKKSVFIIIISALVTLFVANGAIAGYYTIRLNNGKEITVKKYWDEGKTIRFYINGGSVGIPKENIQHIAQQPGNAPAAAADKEFMPFPDVTAAEPESPTEASLVTVEKQTEKNQLEIRERIDIVNSNIATLMERKNNYAAQRTVALDARMKAEEQLEKARTTPYLPTGDRKQAEEGEQRKIIDAETRIRDADQAIANVEEMIAKQETIKRNLEDRLR